MKKYVLGYLALLLLLPARAPHADIIHLKNGRTLEGVVKEETAKTVILDVGLGSITLKRSKIERIERADSPDSIKEVWKDKYFTHKQYVPGGLEHIAADFNGLANARQQSQKAVKRIDSLQLEIQDIQKNTQHIEDELLHAVSSYQHASATDDPIAYNRIIARHNALRGEHMRLIKAYEQHIEDIGKQRQIIHKYLRALDIFIRKVNKRSLETDNREKKAFLKKIEQRLQGYAQEVHRINIDSDVDENGQFFITAKLNGKMNVRMLVDTGASSVSITEDIARTLNLSIDDSRKTQVTLANGEVTDAVPVILDSVAVGDSVVEQVYTVVLGKGDYGKEVDGLLGMSFLQEFMIYMDPSDYQLVLQQFDPK